MCPARVTSGQPVLSLGCADPLSSFYPQEDPCCPSSLHRLLAQAAQRLFTHRSFSWQGQKMKIAFFFSIPPTPNPQSFSSAEANGAKKGTRQHIKHYSFNLAPVPHLPMSASCPSFLWLSSLLLSACCLWFAPSGCCCFDLLNLCNPDPNP